MAARSAAWAAFAAGVAAGVLDSAALSSPPARGDEKTKAGDEDREALHDSVAVG